MPKTDMINGQNMFPRGNYVEYRAGIADYATGLTGNIKTLALHSAMSGTETLFGATPSGIYNVSSAGAVGASVIARTVGDHRWVNFGDGTNNWLIMVNGTDAPAYYNGAAWTAVTAVSVPAITGVTASTLTHVTVYQGRLFFIQTGTLKTWYLPSGVVGGAALAFDLSTQAARGGYLMAALNWTFDGGSGSDDHIAFLTSMGEVIVYQGTDPAVAANWSKIGTYYIGKPIGRECMCKYGGDILVLTEDGIVALSGALSGVINESKYKVSDKIKNLYLELSKRYSSVYGWQLIVYPKENALIVNIPILADTTTIQYVMNMQTGAWAYFANWSATCFAVYNKELYCGLTTKTKKAWSGTTDYGSAIVAFFSTAYTALGTPKNKKIRAIRYQTSGNTSATSAYIAISSSIRYDEDVDGGGNGSPISLSANEPNVQWSTPVAYPGTWISARFYINDSVSGGLLRVNSIEYLYEEGSVGA